MRKIRHLILLFAVLVGIVALAIPASAQSSNYLIVNAVGLNLRTGPGAQYASLGVLSGGESYDIDGISPDLIWFHIVGTPFGDGWVRGRHTIFRGDINSIPIITGPYGVLATATLYVNIVIPVYAQPGGPSIGMIPGNREYLITGRSADSVWVQLETGVYGSVWTHVSRGAFRGTWSNIPILYGVEAPTEAPTEPYLIVNAYALNVRTGPGVEFASLGTVRGGDVFEIGGVSSDGIWFNVMGTPYGNGWMRGRHTIFRGDRGSLVAIPGPYGSLAPAYFYVHIYIPVYDAPHGQQLGLIPGRIQYLVTGRNLDGSWIQLQTPEFGEVWTQFSRGSFRGYYFNVPLIE